MKVAIADHPDEHFAGDVRPPPPTNVATKNAIIHPTGRPPATPQ
jgi:hypothetical protein